MQFKKFFIFFLVILLTLINLAFAEIPATIAGDKISTFTPVEWNKALDPIEKNMSKTDWTPVTIKKTLNDIAVLQNKAKECVTYTQGEIAKITSALPQPSTEQTVTPTATKNIIPTHLDDKRIELNYLRAECQLFLLRAQDITSHANLIQQQLMASLLFVKQTSPFENFIQLPTFKEAINQFNLQVFLQKSGIYYFNLVQIILLSIILTAAILAGINLRNAYKVLQKDKTPLPLSTFFSIMFYYAYPILISTILTIYFIFFSWPQTGSTYLAYISICTLLYIFSLILIRSFFNPPYHARAFILLREPIPEYLSTRLFYLSTLTYIFYLTKIVFYDQTISSSLVQLGITIFITLLSIILISLVWVLTHAKQSLYEWNFFRTTLNISFSLILIFILIAELIGYRSLSEFILKNIAISVVLLFITLLIHTIIKRTTQRIENKKILHHLLGINLYKSIKELLIIQMIFLIILWSSFIVLLSKVWILSEAYFIKLIESLSYGFYVADLFIVPSRILLAIFAFAFLGLINHWLQFYVSKHTEPHIDDAQVTIATVIGYIGFAIIILICLVIAGVNFTGLAIIAGALSVGIGFGLQNIVNNFICGLILLIESPIRPGDRIQIGDVEGFVKKIRLRATQITTVRCTDVFIPNADLVSKNVTNMMFRNARWRIVRNINVAYGSDVTLVKNILLQIASEHAEVIQDGPDAPSVLFCDFQESAISFQLICVIRDVNKRFIVESDFNHLILKMFKENNITIPFPQRDLHIKNSTEPLN